MGKYLYGIRLNLQTCAVAPKSKTPEVIKLQELKFGSLGVAIYTVPESKMQTADSRIREIVSLFNGSDDQESLLQAGS